jgi:four helix bundle protein
MKETPIKTKSYAFAIRIVRLFQWLCEHKNERILSRQILRCGTSIGANIEEASGSYSEKEFLSKLQIAFKEALETRYWLRLLHDTEYIGQPSFDSIYSDCDELVRLLSATTKTLREKSLSVRETPGDDDFPLYSTPNS